MEARVLSVISGKVLGKPFYYKGKVVPYREYLKEQVLPFLDTSTGTVEFKDGNIVSIREFLENGVYYTCQNKYNGNFLNYARDNIISFDERKKVSDKSDSMVKFSIDNMNFSPTAKTYTFFEDSFDGAKYCVIVDKGNVFFAYKDSNFDVIMHKDHDKQEFLKRIKKIDQSYFKKIYDENPVFKEFVGTFKSEHPFYDRLLEGVVRRDSFDALVDAQISDLTDLIEQNTANQINLNGLEKSSSIPVQVSSGSVKIDASNITKFDTNKCLNIVIGMCRSYYSDFSYDIREFFLNNNVNEKAEYIVEQILAKTLNSEFLKYVKSIEEAVNEDLELEINEEFLSSLLDSLIPSLKSNLKKLFVYPYRDKSNDSSEDYINAVVSKIKDEIVAYEELVNSTIEKKLGDLGYELKDRNQEVAPKR